MNSLTRQIRDTYSQDTLRGVCTLPEDKFGEYFGMQTVACKPQWSFPHSPPADYYHYRDNGSHVLAVSHLDTVVRPKGRVPRFTTTKRGPMITSGALDDRLGAYVITSLLPRLGVTCDWLFTVGEESGQSTAEHFTPPKDYDWVIEFDRMGTDVVMYQYKDPDSCAAVEECGTTVGEGSFSDIAYLEHLNRKAFNWGVGYRGNYHSEQGYAFLDDTFAMVAKYLKFHEQNLGITMHHDKFVSYEYDCGFCPAVDSVSSITWYCVHCGTCQDCGKLADDDCMCYIPERLREETRS